MLGARVTDAVEYMQRRQESKGAVRIVRRRQPDKFRWRDAVSKLSGAAGRMRGKERMRIEEPVREVVLDLSDNLLRRECVIDARRFNVDLDRGEVLPFHRMGDLRRYAFLVGADVQIIERYVELPDDFFAPIDTAACTVVSRAMANHHRKRAQRAWLEIPDPDGGQRLSPHQRLIVAKAEEDAQTAKRWAALARTLVDDKKP